MGCVFMPKNVMLVAPNSRPVEIDQYIIILFYKWNAFCRKCYMSIILVDHLQYMGQFPQDGNLVPRA